MWATQVNAHEIKADYVSTYFNVSEGENKKMKKMCGLEDTPGDDTFTKWYKELFAKHQYVKDKAQVIATAVKKCYIFDEAEILLYQICQKNGKERLDSVGYRKASGFS